MPEHLSSSIWLYNSLFRKYDLAKCGSAMKQKRFIFTIFKIWGWYTTLFTIMKKFGLSEGISEVDCVQRLIPNGYA